LDNRKILLIFVSTNNQLKQNKMKKLNLIIAIIALVGQVTGFVGIFIADSNNQLMLSLWTFLGFGCVGAIALITDAKEVKEIPNNIL
jgi:hypothetical membrane protein